MPVSDKSALYIDKLDPQELSATVDQKLKKLEESGREYGLTEGGLLIYQSKGGVGLALNAQATDKFGEEIACRHLAGNLMTKTQAIKGYHEIYASIDSIAKEEYLRDNVFDASRLDVHATYYRVFDYANLGQNLKAIAESLDVGEESRFMFDSEAHSMGLTVARKPVGEGDSQYVVKFYDPNMTDQHTRIIAPTLSSLTTLDVDDILDNADMDLLFPTFNTLTMFSPKLRDPGAKAVADVIDDLDGALYHCLISNISEPIPKLCRLLKAKYNDNYQGYVYSLQAIDCRQSPGFNLAMTFGGDSAVKAYMEYILHSNLNKADKLKIFKANVSHRSVLSIGEDREHDRDTLKTYLFEVANTEELSMETKQELLIGADYSGMPFLYRELNRDHSNSVGIYVKTIAGSKLDEETKLTLLTSVQGRTPALYRACAVGHTESVKVYLHSVLNSNLSNNNKQSLLNAKGRFGASGLHVALKNNHIETAKALVEAIIASPLDKEEKVTLLLAENDKGESGLYWAILRDDEETVNYFIQAIKDAELTDAFKDRMCHSTADGDTIALCIEKIDAHGSISPDSGISGEEPDVADRHEEGRGHVSPKG